jgi:hypothetical protein
MNNGLKKVSVPFFPYYGINWDDYYNYAAVGAAMDYDLAGLAPPMDRGLANNIEDYILLSCSHEITHTLSELSDNYFELNFTYGLMIPEDQRSYNHDGTILFLRSSLPAFDNPDK